MDAAAKKLRALEAVEAGAIRHAHPFTWGIDAPYLDLKPAVFQRLTREGLVKVGANAPDYWRPVHLTEAGRAFLDSNKGKR